MGAGAGSLLFLSVRSVRTLPGPRPKTRCTCRPSYRVAGISRESQLPLHTIYHRSLGGIIWFALRQEISGLIFARMNPDEPDRPQRRIVLYFFVLLAIISALMLFLFLLWGQAPSGGEAF